MAAQQWVQGMWGQIRRCRCLQRPWHAATTGSRVAMRGVLTSHHYIWKLGTLPQELNSSSVSMARDSMACTDAPQARQALTRWT